MELLSIIVIIGAAVLWIKKYQAEKTISQKEKFNQLLSKKLSELQQKAATEHEELQRQHKLQIEELQRQLKLQINALLLKGIAERANLQNQYELQISELQNLFKPLEKYRCLNDEEIGAYNILIAANEKMAQAKITAEEANKKLLSADAEAARILTAARQQANHFADIAKAMENIVEGYGDAYIVPTYSLLDDLADEFGYTEGGKKLKEAREKTRAMIKKRRAATCDYIEENRRENAARFIVDAFNGKVDSILSLKNSDNYGKLEQRIKDAFVIVNNNGTAFRHTRITEAYLAARLEELKWAAITQALKQREREEQRQIREQMREEEKARIDYERVIKEAGKEEDAIKKAIENTQQQAARASDTQRIEFEAKIQDLKTKLEAAEEKNKRALSMAQQTRAGHVYVISNIGSFGDNVFKVGMTRRLDPKDRIRELGDASVPFEFDIHAMIYSEDAPGLETTLHRHFMRQQMNKVNPRKEFFRISLAAIRQALEDLGINASWTMTSHAFGYRESLRIEQQIRDNPAIEQEWNRYQRMMEHVVEHENATVIS